MRVLVDFEEDTFEGDYGDVEVVTATCSRCSHETMRFGTSDASYKRCLALLREECLRDEKNFYIDRLDVEPR